jgi:hypothetical protein
MGKWQMAEGKGQSAEKMHEELLNNLAIAEAVVASALLLKHL